MISEAGPFDYECFAGPLVDLHLLEDREVVLVLVEPELGQLQEQVVPVPEQVLELVELEPELVQAQKHALVGHPGWIQERVVILYILRMNRRHSLVVEATSSSKISNNTKTLF